MKPVGTRTSSPFGRSLRSVASRLQKSPEPFDVATNPCVTGPPHVGHCSSATEDPRGVGADRGYLYFAQDSKRPRPPPRRGEENTAPADLRVRPAGASVIVKGGIYRPTNMSFTRSVAEPRV